MLKLFWKLLVLFTVFGHLNAASSSSNIAFGTKCTIQIYTYTNQASAQFLKASVSSLFSKSPWVERWMTQMNENIALFILQVTQINGFYQTGNQYVASTAIRDRLSTIIQILQTAKSVAINAQVSNSNQLSSDIDAAVSACNQFSSYVVQFTQYNNFVLSLRLMAVVTDDNQISSLGDAIIKSASSLQNCMTSVAYRVIQDTNFRALAFSLDARMYFSAGNNAAANIAIAAQGAVYDTTIAVSTSAAYATLNAQLAILDAYSTSIIVEFNGFAAVAQTAINTLTNTVIRLLVSESTVQSVYIPLGQQILTGLAEAYIAINGQFLIAIQNCKNRIDSDVPGENDTGSVAASNFAAVSANEENYSLKGETNKCATRGRGLMNAMQQQYSKKLPAPVCGAAAILTIMGQVESYQSQCALCGVQLIFNFRLVLSAVETAIRNAINANVQAIEMCAKQASSAQNSAEESGTCISVSLII